MVRFINTLHEIRGIIYVTVSFLYVSAMITIRWHLIAVPLQQSLRVAIHSMKARFQVAVFGNENQTNADEQIVQLLEEARFQVAVFGKEKQKQTVADEQILQLLQHAEKQLDTSFWDKIFWSRGREMNGWRYLHAAARLMSQLYPPEVVEARLRRALSELKDIQSREASDLAKNIEEELKAKQNGDIKFRRALLNGALATIYDVRDNRYNEFDTWDNEAVWMITSGLLLISVLGLTVGNSALFIVGAAGGFLGRLTHLFKVKLGGADYGLYWDPLFMAPVLGAVTGWTGVLVVTLIGKLGLGGSVIQEFRWYDQYNSVALALAFLFGLSERFFVKLVAEAETMVVTKSNKDGSVTSEQQPVH